MKSWSQNMSHKTKAILLDGLMNFGHFVGQKRSLSSSADTVQMIHNISSCCCRVKWADVNKTKINSCMNMGENLRKERAQRGQDKGHDTGLQQKNKSMQTTSFQLYGIILVLQFWPLCPSITKQLYSLTWLLRHTVRQADKQTTRFTRRSENKEEL